MSIKAEPKGRTHLINPFDQLLLWIEIHSTVHWLMLLLNVEYLEDPHSRRGKMQTSQRPCLLMSLLAVTQVLLFDVMRSLLVAVKIALNITGLIAVMLKKYKLGGFPVLKWGLSHAAGEGRGEHMKLTRIFLNMTHQPWCVSLAWVKPCCGISSHIRQIPDIQPSVMKARRRYNNAFMPNSQFMKHDQPNGTKGNYKWQKHLAKHAISDKRLTKNSLAAYMCRNIHGHLIKVIPAFNPLPSF